LKRTFATCLLDAFIFLTIKTADGAYEMEISRREERMVAKMLCLLSTNELGKNWFYEKFRHRREGMS